MNLANLPIIPFASVKKWQEWLLKNSTAQGVWVKFAKKDSGIVSITYQEALEVALCYGWIDGQKNSFDSEYWLQKFTPRRPKSIWSKRNCELVEKLMADKKMRKLGLEKVEAAKKDGRWDKAYEGSKTMTTPLDFLKELGKNKKAQKFFATLNKTNTYAIAWRLHTAVKPETRARRMKVIIEMLSKGEKYH